MAFRKRVYAGFKRKRSGLGVRAYKRRRIARRSRRTYNQSSKATSYSALRFRARKLGTRRFRRILWHATIPKVHYRSVGNSLTIRQVSGGGSAVSGLLHQKMAIADDFWTSVGGAIDPDGGTVPVFKNDVVIRGGRFGLKICNLGIPTQQTLEARVWLVFTAPRANLSLLPSALVYGNDPSTSPEFNNFVGRIVRRWDAKLEVGETWTAQWRLRPQKIDKIVYENNSKRFLWLISVTNQTPATTVDFSTMSFHNLSFSADAT